MSNLSKIVILFFCVILSGYVTVFAEQADLSLIKPEFAKMDADKDGFVTSGEMQSYQFKTFIELDKDKNGTLDPQELTADEIGLHQKADKNEDGKVDIIESNSQFNKYFKEMDKNKDKKVSEAEYTDYWKLIRNF